MSLDLEAIKEEALRRYAPENFTQQMDLGEAMTEMYNGFMEGAEYVLSEIERIQNECTQCGSNNLVASTTWVATDYCFLYTCKDCRAQWRD